MADQNKVTVSDKSGEIRIDFGGICRFCLAETNDGISVNDECLYEESKGLKPESVYSFITKLRIIEVNNFENFPSKICGSCYELIELFYNFSQVCQKSDSLLKGCYESTLKETKMPLNLRDSSNSEVEIPVRKLNILGDKLPQAVQCVIGDQLNHSPKSNEMVGQCPKALSGRITETQSKLTKNPQLPHQLLWCENTDPACGSSQLPHACSQCLLPFSSPRALNFHYAAKHNKRRFRLMLRFQCRSCLKSFSSISRLKRHYQMSHSISKADLTEADMNEVEQLVPTINFFCFQCVPHKQFHTQKQLVKHLEELHKTKQTKGSPILYSCAHCTYATFVTRLSLNQHLLWVHKLREDDIRWSDVKCVSVAQKPPSASPKPLAPQTPPPSARTSRQKTNTDPLPRVPPFAEASHPGPGLPANSLQDENPDSKIPRVDPALELTAASDLANRVHWPSGQEKVVENRAGQSSSEAWNCSECPASYSRKQSLYCHMREKHNRVNPGATKCPECSESFPTNRRLIQHGISVHEKYFAWFHHVFKKVLQPAKEEYREKNFECDTCGRKYLYKTSLRKHVLVAHLGKSPKDAATCPYCRKALSNKLNLKSHIEFVHEALFVSCPICKKKINFRTIGRHYKTHRASAEGAFPGSSFVCNLCGKVLKSKRSFEDHQKLHQNIRDEICDVCGSGFTTKKLLRLHKKTHEGVARKMFACDQCEKVFSGRHTLNRHLLTHSGKKNFICEICSKCFYTIQELNRHVRYHKKDYKFDCQLCDMRFLCKSRFRHHMMKHRNIRPHKCPLCDKMFIERAKMNIHMSAKHNVEVHNTKTVWKDPKTYVPLDDLL